MTELETIKQNLAKMNDFIENRYDPMSQSFGIMQEEQTRLNAEVRKILETQRTMNAGALTRMAGLNDNVPRVPSGRYRGMDSYDLMIANTILCHTESEVAARRESVDPTMLANWRINVESAARALDDTTANAGDELLFTGESSEMWRDVHLSTSVASLFRRMQMPTNPFQYPFDFGDINWYRGTANIAATSTDPNTDRRTITASELVGMIAFSYNLDENSVVAVLPELRQLLIRNAAEVLDDLVLNGDTTDAGANINADGAAAGAVAGTAGKDHWLIFDGLIKIPLVDNTGQRNDHNAAVSDDMFNEIRSKLGRFGVKPSDVAFITDVNTYIRSQSISNIRTLEKFGPQATILTGQLAAVEGVPLIVSEQMLLADTDGKVTSAGNGTDTGRLLIVNRSQYRLGFVREMMVESERDIQKRQTVLVASMRVGFEGRIANASDTAVALQYDITGVS